MKKEYILGFLLVVVVFFLYYPFLGYYFFQDDFYLLRVGQVETVKDFFRFFVPGNEIYYRPLSMRVYFWLVTLVFGASPWVFHFFSVLIHVINSFLVKIFVFRLTKSKWIGWVVAFMYGVSSVHFIAVVWIAEVGLLLGVTFYLFSCIQFMKYVKTEKLSDIFGVFVLFILGILCHEYLITLPVALVAIWLYLKFSYLKNLFVELKRSVVVLVPMWLMVGVYFLARFIIFPVNISSSYEIIVGKETVRAFFWYVAWSINVLENLVDKLEPGFYINQEFVLDFSYNILLIVSTVVLVLVFWVFISLALFVSSSIRQKLQLTKLFVFCVVWVVVVLSIPLSTPYHLYPMYAALALVGVLVFFVSFVFKQFEKRKLFVLIMVVFWVFTSWSNFQVYERIHWVVLEAKRVGEMVEKSRNKHPLIDAGSTIVIEDKYQIQHALFDQLGMQHIYGDYSIKTHFGSLDTVMPEECKINTEIDCLRKHNIFVF